MRTTWASLESMDCDKIFVSIEWFSVLKGEANAEARRACDRELNEAVANCLSFSVVLEFEAREALAAKSLPQSSTKS